MGEATGKLTIIDSITAKPGQGRAVLDRYKAEFVPGAQARGMVLDQTLVSPPLAMIGDRTNTLSFIWQVDGIEGWWAQRFAAAFDPAVRAFWAGLEPLVAHRDRAVHGEAAAYV